MSEAKPGNSNGYDPEKTKGYIERVENIKTQITSEHMAYMSKVGDLKQDISDILDEAKSNGVPKKALRAVLKTRELQQKLEDIREGLEGEDQDSFDMIRHAIGDLAETPLGQHALKRAEQGADAVDSLTSLN